MASEILNFEVIDVSTQEITIGNENVKLINYNISVNDRVLNINLNLQALEKWIKMIEMPLAIPNTESDVYNGRDGYMSATDKTFFDTIVEIYNYLVVDESKKIINDKENPYFIDKYLNESEDGLLYVIKTLHTSLTEHLNNKNNPHEVKLSQIKLEDERIITNDLGDLKAGETINTNNNAKEILDKVLFAYRSPSVKIEYSLNGHNLIYANNYNLNNPIFNSFKLKIIKGSENLNEIIKPYGKFILNESEIIFNEVIDTEDLSSYKVGDEIEIDYTDYVNTLYTESNDIKCIELTAGVVEDKKYIDSIKIDCVFTVFYGAFESNSIQSYQSILVYDKSFNNKIEVNLNNKAIAIFSPVLLSSIKDENGFELINEFECINSDTYKYNNVKYYLYKMKHNNGSIEYPVEHTILFSLL